MILWSLTKFSKNSFLIIFTSFFILVSPKTVRTSCSPIPVVKNPIVFEDYDSTPPANLELTQDFHASKSAQVSTIYVAATNVTEDFTVSLIVNPYVKNEADCHPLNITGNDVDNLRLHKCVVPVLKTDTATTNRSFESILTGCYHFTMTNCEGKHWLHPPIFYNGRFRHCDILIKPGGYKFKPKNTDSSMRIKAVLKVPSEYLDVNVGFFELDRKIENAMASIENGERTSSLGCKKGKKIVTNCGHPLDYKNLTLEGRLVQKDDNGWTGILEWNNLTRGEWQYYLLFSSKPSRNGKPVECEKVINAWRLFKRYIYVPLGYVNRNNTPFITPGTYYYPWFSTSCGLISVIIVVILTYWIKKFRKLLLLPGDGDKDESPIPQEPAIPSNEKESDQILLIYENGSDLFMKEMENLRNNLEKQCSGFNIHDVYAINEWKRVRQLRVPGWVQDRLKSGSKIVWVDTPQFRSRLSNEHPEYMANEFRDIVAPYAVTVATDSFQDSTTQYRRHFVVRINGVEVRDGEQDPFRIVTPHARYYLPGQLDRLCEDLKGPVKLTEKKAVN